MKPSFALVFAAFASFAMPSYATPITEGVWQLENNSTHNLGLAGFYRDSVDGFDLYDFETNGANAQLTYDATAGTILLEGQAYDPVGNRLVDFDLNYTGVSTNGDRTATSFVGLLGTFDGLQVMGKSKAAGSLFIDTLSSGNLSASGWIGTAAGDVGDFHFEGTRISGLPNGSVPVPGGLAFILVAGAGLFIRKRIA